MKKFIRVLLTVIMMAFAGAAMAKGGGKSPAPPPPPPPAPPIPAQEKAPEAETYKRRNRQAGAMGNSGTMLTGNDPDAAEPNVTLGSNTLLGS